MEMCDVLGPDPPSGNLDLLGGGSTPPSSYADLLGGGSGVFLSGPPPLEAKCGCPQLQRVSFKVFTRDPREVLGEARTPTSSHQAAGPATH